MPTAFILKTIEQIIERDKRIANDRSASTAYLACLVASLAGSREQLTPDRFLPYPQGSQKESARVSKQTAKSFLKLVDEGKLLSHVVSSAESFIDSIAAQA